MSSHSWADVWKVFLDMLSRESIAMQIAIGLGVAFFAVMALEGIRASFFPKRILARVALREAATLPPSVSAAPVPQEDIRAAWTAPVEPMTYAPPRLTVNSSHVRRSSPQRMRVIGQRKPS